MSRPIGRHGDHDGFRGHLTSPIVRILRGSVPPLLVVFLVLMGMVLKVPPATTGSIPCDCETCHGDFHGENWTGCSGCHPSPPATGSHPVHYNSAPQNALRYGDTTVRSTAQAYMFGCGNCHPLDQAKHRNGTVDVELYDAQAPPGSLKAKNPSNAAYDPVDNTCSNVYCHSGYSVTSGAVGEPLTYPPDPVPPGFPIGYTLNNSYIMDETCSNLIYAPYTVTVARDYRTSPAWGATGTPTTCTECHAFPLTIYYPAVSAGVGDSHQWVDENGYNWGHAYNMLGVGGVPCATCHNGSVDHQGGVPYPPSATPPTYWTTDSSGNSITAYYPVPIKDRTLHVNGVPDVAFDSVNGYRYYDPTWGYDDQFDLTSATYNAQTKTCSNVSCHYGGTVSTRQQSPKWGSPYGPYSVSGSSVQCDLCHRFGYLRSTCEPVP